MSRRADLRIVWIVAIAALVRVVYVLSVDLQLDDGFDMTWYKVMGHRLAEGHGYTLFDGSPTAFWPPGYPALIAAVTALLGRDVVWLQMVQAAVGALTCWATYALARPWTGSSRALAAAFILALLPDAFAYTPLVLSETFFAFLFVCALLVFSRLAERSSEAPALAWLGLGALTAAAGLVRAIALPLPLAYVGASLWLGAGMKTALRRGVLVGLGLALTIAPWTLRNALRMGHPILLSTQGAEVLAVAHGPYATGGLSLIGGTAEENRRHGREVIDYLMDFSEVPRPEREYVAMQTETSRATRYAISHPLEELGLIPRRLFFVFAHGHKALDWGRVHTPDGQRAPLLGPRADRVLRTAADLSYYVLLLGAVIAVPVTLRSGSAAAYATLLAIAVVCVIHAVVLFGDPRFHQPLLPLLSAMAAAAPVRLPRRFGGSA